MRRAHPALLSTALLGAVLIPVALTRIADGDEGFYVMAGHEVANGRVPYVDFFFLQAPGTPYLFGAWMHAFGETWVSIRLLGALLAIATGLLVHRAVVRRTGSAAVAVLATALYATTVLAAVWLPLAKTYGITALCLMGACTLLDERDARAGRIIMGGFVAGLAVLCRGPVLVVLPALILFSPAGRSLLRRGVLIGSGAAVALLPAALIAIQDLSAFRFGNIGFHALRDDRGLVGGFDQKVSMLLELAGLRVDLSATSPQFLFLAITAAGGVWLTIRAGRRPPLTVPVAAAMFVVMVGPTPTYAQYQSVIVPLLVVAAADAFLPLRDALGDRALLWIFATAVVWLMAGASMLRYFVWDVPPHLELSSIRAVSAEIAARAEPGERVLTLWPGYLLETNAEPVPGLENQFAIQASQALTPRESRVYRLLTVDAFYQAIAGRAPRLVVRGGAGEAFFLGAELDREALTRGYRKVADIDGIEVYVAMSGAAG